MSKNLSEEELNAQANEKRHKHKVAKDKILATKTKEGGLLVVHTGKGKGKTTAAMGIVARCIGHGQKVGIVQFVKGKWETGERVVLAPGGVHLMLLDLNTMPQPGEELELCLQLAAGEEICTTAQTRKSAATARASSSVLVTAPVVTMRSGGTPNALA